MPPITVVFASIDSCHRVFVLLLRDEVSGGYDKTRKESLENYQRVINKIIKRFSFEGLPINQDHLVILSNPVNPVKSRFTGLT